MSKPLQVYICAVFERREWVDGLRVWLEENHGVEVVSRWHQIARADAMEKPEMADDVDATGWSPSANKAAQGDFEEIDQADVIVCCTEEKVDATSSPSVWRGGRHVELGYAIGKGLPIVILGRREATFYHLRTHYIVGNTQQLANVLSTLEHRKRKGSWQQRGIAVRDYFLNLRLAGLSPEDRLRFWALALCGEAGELANQIKKEWRGDPENDYVVNVRGEIADVRIYLERMADELGYNVDQLCEEKVDRLYQRLNLGD